MSDAIKRWLCLAAAAIAVAALTGLSAWIFDAGVTKERAAWQAKETARQAQIAQQLQAEFERGKAASTRFQLAASALQTNYLQLEGPAYDLRRRVPLVLPAPVRGGVPTCPGVHVPVDAEHGAAIPGAAAAAPGEVLGSPGPSDHRLSLAAVWMWNSALVGADTPAGACGLADTSDQACAADSGLTVDDAWRNHETNAKSCAADRLRHQALIEFLNEGPVQ
jgi:hypothetical protein